MFKTIPAAPRHYYQLWLKTGLLKSPAPHGLRKTTRENTVWINNFIHVAGDKPLDQYSKADGRAFKAILMKLPPNWNKQKALKALDIVSAADKAATNGHEANGPQDSQQDHAVRKDAFWNWAAQHYDECPTNPIIGLQVTVNTSSARRARAVFTGRVASRFFSSDLHRM